MGVNFCQGIPFGLDCFKELYRWPGAGDIYEEELDEIKEDFVWWCLAHNLDQAATLATLAKVRWAQGFDAGLTIADFAPLAPVAPGTISTDLRALQQRENQ